MTYCSRRLSFEDGLKLFKTNDFWALGEAAHHFKEHLHGRHIYYNVNRHINYSNVCINGCLFCAFARSLGEKGAWTHSIEAILKSTSQTLPSDATELHIVGGLHPELPFTYYISLLSSLKKNFPNIHLKAFTATEIAHFSKLFEKSIYEILDCFQQAGLGSLPGGGAEIFTPSIRRKICPSKLDGDTWLSVHRIAHKLGIPSNASMLYGHIETPEDRVNHLLKLRALQDETGGFQAFIPLAYKPSQSSGKTPIQTSIFGGVDHLKTIAASRLLLDNIPHIKAYWVMLGIDIAQLATHFGADDLDGTIVEENIGHMADASSPRNLHESQLRKMIEKSGGIPTQRNTFYQIMENTAH